MNSVVEVVKGSKTDLSDGRYAISIHPESVDILAVLVGVTGKVRSDEDLVFFNNPVRHGVELVSEGQIVVDLSTMPAHIDRVVIAGSAESQGTNFGALPAIRTIIAGSGQSLSFISHGLTTETVLQLVGFYRRNGRWRLDAVGQGYQAGLAAFADDHGIVVDDPGTGSEATAPPLAQPTPSTGSDGPINFSKVAVTITKDSPSKTASIDLRKNNGDTSWILTVGLWWDGRGAKYFPDGRVRTFGEGDLDVYFFCRNEYSNDYIVISGEPGHQGGLTQWPFIHHYGDSRGPGAGNLPAVEQVRVLPQENGDLLVNVYQAIDNGTGAINKFGRPRVVIRYGRPGSDGLPAPDADEIIVHVGNGRNSYWATVAHIDVRDGILTVDGRTRYSHPHSERMPGLNTRGKWVREPVGGPVGKSKKEGDGLGLDCYHGACAKPGT
ncbi:TerD family protein [Nocardia sp. NPDC005978]|uniref:TerD family protein n=1 Tax=Nocardia sp. NPDC005978 TaxID=3156725 RepID=UPI0033A427EA